MNKRQAHHEAFGYEPLRMKPAHFASGFFLALTDRTYANELLNKVAVTKTNRGLLEEYAPEAVVERLRRESRIGSMMTQAKVELLRIQVNGVVNNDAAMYPAFWPYRPKGNDYTFFSRRMLTRANRTDGYAGYFVALVLGQREAGRRVLEFGTFACGGVTPGRWIASLHRCSKERKPGSRGWRSTMGANMGCSSRRAWPR